MPFRHGTLLRSICRLLPTMRLQKLTSFRSFLTLFAVLGRCHRAHFSIFPGGDCRTLTFSLTLRALHSKSFGNLSICAGCAAWRLVRRPTPGSWFAARRLRPLLPASVDASGGTSLTLPLAALPIGPEPPAEATKVIDWQNTEIAKLLFAAAG